MAARRTRTITTQQTVSPAPTMGGQLAADAPQPQVVSLQVDPTKEYVAGGYQPWFLYQAMVRALPLPIDDLTLSFGDDIYTQMLLHPQVFSNFTTLRAGVLSEGVELTSAVADDTDPEFDLAKTITEECERQLADLETPLDDVLWDMQEAMAFGNRIAELVWEDGGRTLRAIKVKPRSSLAFCVDAFANIVGLLPLRSNSILGLTGVLAVDQLRLGDKQDPDQKLLPREKFAVLTFRPRNNDPRGTSILRAAYGSWWNSVQIVPEHLRYLSQFASPSLVGVTAPGQPNQPARDQNGQIILDATTGKTLMLSPEEVLGARLATFQNGTYIVVPHDGDVKAISVQGDGAAFLHGFAQWNREIARAILNQTLATEEGEHQARAAAGVHQDVMGTLFRQGKKASARMLRGDVLRTWVRYNYGAEREHLTPLPSLGETEQQDQAALLMALGKVGFSLDPSQFAGVDTLASLPPRDPDSVTDAITARKQALAQPAADQNGGQQQPGQDGQQQQDGSEEAA